MRSESNLADIISRGVSPGRLKDLRLWWRDPEWLENPEKSTNKDIPIPSEEIPESKNNMVCIAQVIEIYSQRHTRTIFFVVPTEKSDCEKEAQIHRN